MTITSQTDPFVRHLESTKAARPGGFDGLLDIPTLADHLGVSERFVRRLVDERRITFHKVGKFVRFRPEEVNQWVARCRVDAVR